MNFVAQIGRVVIALCGEIGRLMLFSKAALAAGLMPPIYFRQLFDQLIRIGYNSLPVVGLTAFFTGGVLALQIYIGGSRFNAESVVPSIVSLAITRELGPVLAGLMVAGRVAAAIAAELGTMRVTEQIDALTTLSTNPYKYLVLPRLLAAVISLPLLVLIGDIIGVMGSYIVATESLGFNSGAFIRNMVDFLELQGRGLRPDQIGSVRFHHRADGVLSRLQQPRRRSGCRPGDDQCGGIVGDPDPGGKLCPHFTAVFRNEQTSPHSPQRRAQELRPEACSQWRQSGRGAWPLACGDRWLGHRQVGDAQMHSGAASS